MSVLLFGASYKSAPVSVLEKLVISDDDRAKVVNELLQSSLISEAMIVSTCNRMEIYAVVDAFHPALEQIGKVIGQRSGMTVNEMTKHAYVRYSEAAVEHLFSVASGLDSIVVGEQQILGQIRASYSSADQHNSAGRILHELAQKSLKVGKRVHTETGIDRAGASVVSVSVGRAVELLGAPIESALVIGAGAMGGLAAAHLARNGVRRLVVANRTHGRAVQMADNISKNHEISTSAITFDEVTETISDVDVVVTCTGSTGTVISVGDVHRALKLRNDSRQLIICDLGLPRDVDPAAARLPGVELIDIEGLRDNAAAKAAQSDTEAAKVIVSEELADYLLVQRQAEVTPTVTALRQRAAEVVEAELLRLQTRVPELTEIQRDEVSQAVRRVVEKLLHSPTVRVKALASTSPGDSYAEALRELFDLTPGAAEAVTAVGDADGGVIEAAFAINGTAS